MNWYFAATLSIILLGGGFDVSGKTNYNQLKGKNLMIQKGEDGYELWLRYRKVDNAEMLERYQKNICSIALLGKSKTFALIESELQRALPILLDKPVPVTNDMPDSNAVIVSTVDNLRKFNIKLQANCGKLGDEGYLIQTKTNGDTSFVLIAANTNISALHGVFGFLRLLQTHQDISSLDIVSVPRIHHRILAHWDNLDGSIERGYAGGSLWNWSELPNKIDTRYHDYARACASIGINGTILNNANAKPESLTAEYLKKTAALADVFRPYGIKVYLTAFFSSPMQIDNLETADPREPEVARWWQEKVDEIYELIPDFGGFQIKANSEGQPGPQDYDANHDDGANMLAKALESHGGIVLWRAFVYNTDIDSDRANCAYQEFVPLDGRFNSNVFVQVKNGPIDFQPREPFNPLFGAMPKTPLAIELQVTQEYLGQSTHLVYLAPMWKEVLDSDTFAKGPGSTVASITDGSLDEEHTTSAIVAVANTGSDRNWCGHHFAQANWYTYGRLAWDHQLSSEQIAEEWIRMTWSNDPLVVDSIKKMILGSWEACINYMTPLGLHHIMQEGHHYGPDPSFDGANRADWNSVYYHKADANGLGFNRSTTGSNAVTQYHSPLCRKYDDIKTCPEELLLWFHHVPWDYKLKSGRTLWDELEYKYDIGVEYVDEMIDIWQSLKSKIDPQRYEHVNNKLKEQQENARLWQQVCIDYFSKFTKRKR